MEAKHGVKVRSEDAVSASVSYQAFFRYYRKLAGMTVRGRGGVLVHPFLVLQQAGRHGSGRGGRVC